MLGTAEGHNRKVFYSLKNHIILAILEVEFHSLSPPCSLIFAVSACSLQILSVSA